MDHGIKHEENDFVHTSELCSCIYLKKRNDTLKLPNDIVPLKRKRYYSTSQLKYARDKHSHGSQTPRWMHSFNNNKGIYLQNMLKTTLMYWVCLSTLVQKHVKCVFNPWSVRQPWMAQHIQNSPKIRHSNSGTFYRPAELVLNTAYFY